MTKDSSTIGTSEWLGFDEPTDESGDSTSAYQLLGGYEMLRMSVRHNFEVDDLIASGLPLQALEHLVDGLTVLRGPKNLGMAIGADLGFFQGTQVSYLSAEQSNRVWRFANVLAKAIDAVGDMETAEHWLLQPAIALDQQRPVELLSSASDAKLVLDTLIRLEYGVYT